MQLKNLFLGGAPEGNWLPLLLPLVLVLIAVFAAESLLKKIRARKKRKTTEGEL